MAAEQFQVANEIEVAGLHSGDEVVVGLDGRLLKFTAFQPGEGEALLAHVSLAAGPDPDMAVWRQLNDVYELPSSVPDVLDVEGMPSVSAKLAGEKLTRTLAVEQLLRMGRLVVQQTASGTPEKTWIKFTSASTIENLFERRASEQS